LVSGINVNALSELKKYLGMETPALVKDTITQMAHTGDDVIDFLKVDVKSVNPRVPDNQSVMPFGTPGEVREETKRRIEDLAPGGGFIFAPIHVIPNGVPPENIMAWWETLQEYGSY